MPIIIFDFPFLQLPIIFDCPKSIDAHYYLYFSYSTVANYRLWLSKIYRCPLSLIVLNLQNPIINSDPTVAHYHLRLYLSYRCPLSSLIVFKYSCLLSYLIVLNLYLSFIIFDYPKPKVVDYHGWLSLS